MTRCPWYLEDKKASPLLHGSECCFHWNGEKCEHDHNPGGDCPKPWPKARSVPAVGFEEVGK